MSKVDVFLRDPMAMPAEHLDRWIDALESDRYKQTQGRLTRRGPYVVGVEHCSLGVYASEFGIEDADEYGGCPYDALPIDSRLQLTVTRMNDMELRDFKQIAAWLRLHREKIIAGTW